MDDNLFDEIEWDLERQHLEHRVKRAAYDLICYMGCNNIQMPLGNLTVKITPKEEK